MAKKQTLWNRFITLFTARAHRTLDSLEDGSRIDILRQKVRELENGHGKSINGLAKVKALQFKFEKDAASFKTKAADYRDKATKLKARYSEANKKDQAQIKSDIILMLNKSESMEQESKAKALQAKNQGVIVDSLEVKIKEMTTLIKSTKANITNMEARAEAAKVNRDISKELSDVNFGGVSSQIEEIEKKINEDNAEAEAWEHIDTAFQSDEDRINKILEEDLTTDGNKLFDDFMSSK